MIVVSWSSRLASGSVVFLGGLIELKVVVLTADLFVIYYSDRMKSKRAKGKEHGLKSW